jgi:hypothetical protein
MHYRFIYGVLCVLLWLVEIAVLMLPNFGYFIYFGIFDNSYFALFLFSLFSLFSAIFITYLVLSYVNLRQRFLKHITSALVFICCVWISLSFVLQQILPIYFESVPELSTLSERQEFACDIWTPVFSEFIFKYLKTDIYDPTATLPC